MTPNTAQYIDCAHKTVMTPDLAQPKRGEGGVSVQAGARHQRGTSQERKTRTRHFP